MRLIDADALIAEMHNVILEDGEDRRIFYEVIERQPTIEPERKKGKWIRDAVWFTRYYCSQCGEKTEDTIMGEPRYKWCPMCGAKMEAET